jgi:flagellar motor switch protein FliN/FliY
MKKMPSPDVTESSRSFAATIGGAISVAITEASGLNWRFEVADTAAETHSLPADAQWYRFNFEGSIEGAALIAVERGAGSILGLDSETAKDAGDATSPDVELLAAFQAATPNLEKLLADHGAVLVSIEATEPPELQDTSKLVLEGRCKEKESRIAFSLHLTKKLDMQLLALAAKPHVFPSAANPNAANLDLVLDVALNVTLRFGQRQLALREILELGSGSVVELDRQVDEPVELVLDGRVVARGEAVIIDGNYGMRITQVVQPIES